MGRLALALAWVLSVLALLAPVPGPRTPLCLLPWLALGGLPRVADPAPGEGLARSRPHPLALNLNLALALALAPVGLGVAVDGGGTAPMTQGLWTALGALALFVLLVSGRCASHPYGILWTVFVVGVPLLAAVVAWDGEPGGGSPALGALATLSPLQWLWERAAGAPPVPPLGPLALTLILVAVGRSGRGGRGEAGQ